MVDVSKQFLDMGVAAHRDVIAGLEASVETDIMLDAHAGQACMDERSADRFCAVAFDFGVCVVVLVYQYHPDVPMFHLTDTSHLLLHMGFIGKWINPGIGSCTQGEEMMAIARRIVATSARGSKPITI